MKTPQLIAMVHVHSNNALQNTIYNDGFGVTTYAPGDLAAIDLLRRQFHETLAELTEKTGLDLFNQCRTAVLLTDPALADELAAGFAELPFVQRLIQRAVKDVGIYEGNGITHVAIENVGAPYFIGNEVPVEDMEVMYLVAHAVRKEYPKMNIGIHVLSSNELEALPIALSCNALFVRSESAMFSGFRPEGKTINRGNLAKFYYMRNYLSALMGKEESSERRRPALWADFQKKHTVFEAGIQNLAVWLDNIVFQKLEGIILTGAETGSDIGSGELQQAREAIDRAAAQIQRQSGREVMIPLITGSGLDLPIYKKYA
ncbi:MAG TPA: BtpA/SgcQ family protein, partial [Candidatus Polarisedimenticolaceae bacterium]|nr:BtpA/SgcQ family protein [Candidatus Polarisedimenticolaceae bacterium]